MQDARPRYLRSLLFDIYPYEVPDDAIRAAQASLQLVPSSAEGVKIERDQSVKRMMATKPLADPLAALSVWSAEAVTQYVIDQIADPDAPVDRIREVLVTQNAQVIGISVQSIIAHLLETGVLEYKKD